ncbi:agmatinase [bacterium]|nr:agmatinase [bacterium]
MPTIHPPNSAPFLGASIFKLAELQEGLPAILGCGYDGTTSFRPGTRWGPDAFRSVSDEAIETFSPAQNRDLKDITFADLGNLEIPYGAPEPVVELLYQATLEILKTGAIPIILGGEHSISPGSIKAVFEKHPDLVVVQFDAHADLRHEWNGTPNSHACAMRRVLDFLPADQLLQVGIRSGTRDEFAEMGDRLIAPTASALSAALPKEAPLYITFDLDLFDPSLLSGTGTPEPGGIDWATFEAMLALLKGANIVGLDIVELAPTLDPSGVSPVVAAKMLREWLLTLPVPETRE